MRNTPAPPDHEVEFIAGALCLDFVNTVGGTHERPTHDHLGSYADLVAFARAADALSPGEARRLSAGAEVHPREAAAVLRRAVELREAIFRAFAAVAAGRSPAPADVGLVSAAAAEALGHARVVREGAGFTWGWSGEVVLERPLWPIARSAAELLTSDADRDRVRECGSVTCAWLFVDRSRNHSRRWCDMNDCGNRAKASRFRERQRTATRRSRSTRPDAQP